jgi:hypothetical protein
MGRPFAAPLGISQQEIKNNSWRFFRGSQYETFSRSNYEKLSTHTQR